MAITQPYAPCLRLDAIENEVAEIHIMRHECASSQAAYGHMIRDVALGYLTCSKGVARVSAGRGMQSCATRRTSGQVAK